MSKRFFAMTLVFALILAAPFAVAEEKKEEATKGPRLTLVEPVKDFGTVPKGEKLDWAFENKNSGTTDLEILAAKPACGCTVAEFDRVIKPGATGKVKAHVDTAAFAGPISKSITLETNDPTAPNAQITIAALVKPFVDVHPTGFLRFNMLQSDVERQTVTLYSDEVEPFEIVEVQTPQDWIKVEKTKLEGPTIVPTLGRPGQNQYKFELTLVGPEAPVGVIAEKVRIVTNSKHQPEFFVNLTGVVRPTFRVEPTGINFGEIVPNDPAATRSILLRSNNLKAPESFLVTKAESNVPGVTAGVTPTANKGEFTVTLQVEKAAKPGVIDGTVTIHTSDKVNPTVTIPVKGTIKSTATATTGSK